MTEIQAFTIDTNEPVEISTGVTMQLSDSGLKKYVLNTPRIEKYIINEEDIYKFPIGFELLTFDTLGVQVTSISAKRGSMKQKLGEIVLEDSVRIVNISQEQLSTELLNVFLEQDSISTTKPVTISSLAGTLTGKFGLTSDLNFTEYEMHKVDGEIETTEIYDEREEK